MQQVGLECAQTHPKTSQIILRDFYIDDLLSDTETVAAAPQRKHELSAILAKAGFQLHKWAPNCPSIVAEELSGGKVIAKRDPRIAMVCDRGLFVLRGKLINQSRVTKRIILFEIAQIFDPLGLMGQ